MQRATPEFIGLRDDALNLHKRIATWGFEQVHWNELFERTDSMKWVELPIIVVLCVYLEM